MSRRKDTNSNPYGTLNGPVPSSDNVAGQNEAEEQPLLGGNPKSRPWWRRNMSADLSRDWADAVLLACYVITGLLDSASISTWGAFVSMQTGNTVYLGLGPTAGTNRWKKSGLSLCCFALGSYLFSRLHRVLSPTPRTRWVLCLSFALQAALIAAAAAIVTWGPRDVGPEDVSWYVLVPMGLVAFQSCGQAVASRALKYNALTSVVLTSIYCDLFSDAELFAGLRANAERNRRVAAPVLLLAGVLVGGVLANSSLGAGGALWTAVGLKSMIVVSWFFWPEEK
ncbi:hypothetical protein ACRALDRAFT_1083167 [Sodiomyces alcalophilus JCM 7366]|uniref:uncharacterized protein n=1 Tax=Sodiomyces alcalophilus JCM 7366 TaxID=591952 RepID=UPI0039B52F03